MKKTILIVDDEILIARDLESICRELPDTETYIATKAKDAVQIAAERLPHIVLMDINLNTPAVNGITLAESIVAEIDTNFIFITAHKDNKSIEEAARLQPLGYIVKPYEEVQILAQLKVLLTSESVINAGVARTKYQTIFTKTEYKIVQLIAQNKTTPQIAEELFISEKTVENHRGNIAKKLNLSSKINSLLVWAIEHKDKL